MANGFGLATTQTQGEIRIPVRKLNPLQSLFRKPSQKEIGARCGGTSLYSEIEATKSQRILRVAWSTGKRKDSQSYTTDDTSWKRTSAVAQLLVKGQLLSKHSAWVCLDPQHKDGKHSTLWWEPHGEVVDCHQIPTTHWSAKSGSSRFKLVGDLVLKIRQSASLKEDPWHWLLAILAHTHM